METLLLVFFAHWVGDFVFQTRYMADNKSKDLKALAWHVGVYSVALVSMVGLWAILVSRPPLNFYLFGLINYVAHFIIDFITSRMTSFFWAEKQIKAFFTTIGFDQFLHTSTLVITSYLYL